MSRGLCLAVSLLLSVSCATPQSPTHVMIEPDPLTGSPTAYTTVFLADDGARLVLSGAVGESEPVRVTLWLGAESVRGSCETPRFMVNDHEVQPASVEARVLETPSGSDQTVSFTIPPAVLRGVVEHGGRVSGCGAEWPLDDDDRRGVQGFLDALRQESGV